MPEFRAGLKSVNILLDTPMTPKQLEALVTHAARHNHPSASLEMINYEDFLQSFDVIDVEDRDGSGAGKADAQAALSSTRSRHQAQSDAAAELLQASGESRHES